MWLGCYVIVLFVSCIVDMPRILISFLFLFA